MAPDGPAFPPDVAPWLTIRPPTSQGLPLIAVALATLAVFAAVLALAPR
jgi:hypothetical protein